MFFAFSLKTPAGVDFEISLGCETELRFSVVIIRENKIVFEGSKSKMKLFKLELSNPKFIAGDYLMLVYPTWPENIAAKRITVDIKGVAVNSFEGHSHKSGMDIFELALKDKAMNKRKELRKPVTEKY